jgi:hypothetical protein
MDSAVTQYIKLTDEYCAANSQPLVAAAPFDRQPVDVRFMVDEMAL